MLLPATTRLTNALDQLYQNSQKKWFWQRLSFPQLISGATGGVLATLSSAAIFWLLYKFYMAYTDIDALSITFGVLGTLPTIALMTVFAVPKFASFLVRYDSDYKLLLYRETLINTCLNLLKIAGYLAVSFFATLADSYVTYIQYTELMGVGFWPVLFACSDFISTLVVRYALLENIISKLLEKTLKFKNISKFLESKLSQDELNRSLLLIKLDHAIKLGENLSDEDIQHLGSTATDVYSHIMDMDLEEQNTASSSWFSASTILGIIGCGLGLYAATYYIPLAYAANQALCVALGMQKYKDGYSSIAVPFTYMTAASLYSESTAETFSNVTTSILSYFLPKKSNHTMSYEKFSGSKMDFLDGQLQQSIEAQSCLDLKELAIENQDQPQEDRKDISTKEKRACSPKKPIYHLTLVILALISTAVRGQLIRENVHDESDNKLALMSVSMFCGFVMRYWSSHLFCQKLNTAMRQDNKTKLTLFLRSVKDLGEKANRETVQELLGSPAETELILPSAVCP